MQRTLNGAAAPGARRDRSLHGQLVDALGTLIVAAPTDPSPLDPEQIAAEHHVSRTVVRETLRTLAAKGMVQARPNSGTRIRPIAEWNLLDPQVIGWRAMGPTARDQARDLAQISVALEPLTARLAAERTADIDPRTRERLAESAALMTDAAKAADPERFAEADIEFHTLLAGASGNPALEYLAGLLHAQLKDHGIALCAAETDSAAAHAALVQDVLDGEAKYAESIARDTIAAHRAVPGQHRNGSVHTTGDEAGEK